MDQVRKIAEGWRGRPVIEGAGVHLKRVFGFSEVPRMDPFLLLDDFRSRTPDEYLHGFPWHPHRGIETITYMLYGAVAHGDSLGNEGVIGPGDVQWMTAGSGIIHQEMPRGDADGRMGGFQLWSNLPAAAKMTRPRYREVKSNDIPIVELACGGSVRIISGSFQGVIGPVRDLFTTTEYMDISLPGETEYIHRVADEFTVLVYVISGEARFGARDDSRVSRKGEKYYDPRMGNLWSDGDFLRFGSGDFVRMETGSRSVRLLFISGLPIGEPVAWRGPIVMNSERDLDIAFEELRRNVFIRHDDGGS